MIPTNTDIPMLNMVGIALSILGVLAAIVYIVYLLWQRLQSRKAQRKPPQ